MDTKKTRSIKIGKKNIGHGALSLCRNSRYTLTRASPHIKYKTQTRLNTVSHSLKLVYILFCLYI